MDLLTILIVYGLTVFLAESVLMSETAFSEYDAGQAADKD